ALPSGEMLKEFTTALVWFVPSLCPVATSQSSTVDQFPKASVLLPGRKATGPHPSHSPANFGCSVVRSHSFTLPPSQPEDDANIRLSGEKLTNRTSWELTGMVARSVPVARSQSFT